MGWVWGGVWEGGAGRRAGGVQLVRNPASATVSIPLALSSAWLGLGLGPGLGLGLELEPGLGLGAGAGVGVGAGLGLEWRELGLEIGAREGVETLLALRHELTMSTCGHMKAHGRHTALSSLLSIACTTTSPSLGRVSIAMQV